MSEIIETALAGGLSLAGIPLQQAMQKDLMHENESINLRQWNRENAYNDPSQQMARLKRAGLNPNLVVGGNMANTASPMSPTAGTPSAPNATAGVASAIQNAQSQQLIDSQIEMNQAKAKKDTSDASMADEQLRFLRSTFQTRVDQLSANLNLTQSQKAETDAKVLQISELTALAIQQQAFYREMAWKTSKEGQIVAMRAMLAPDLAIAELNEIRSRYKLNDAETASINQDVKFYEETWNLRKRFMKSQINVNRAQAGFYDKQTNDVLQKYADFMDAQTRWLPMQIMSHLSGDVRDFRIDDDGNIEMSENGMPKLAVGYNRLQRGLNVATEIMGIIERGTSVFGNVASGLGMLKFGKSSVQNAFSMQKQADAAMHNAETNRMSFNLNKERYDDFKRSKAVPQTPTNSSSPTGKVYFHGTKTEFNNLQRLYKQLQDAKGTPAYGELYGKFQRLYDKHYY